MTKADRDRYTRHAERVAGGLREELGWLWRNPDLDQPPPLPEQRSTVPLFSLLLSEKGLLFTLTPALPSRMAEEYLRSLDTMTVEASDALIRYGYDLQSTASPSTFYVRPRPMIRTR